MENLKDRSLSAERKKSTTYRTGFNSDGGVVQNEEISNLDSNTREVINREQEQKRYIDQGILLKKL